VQRSSDEGVTWAHADAWLGGSTVTEIGTRPGDGRAFACVGNMILTYDPESRSWAPSSADLPGNRISSIAYDYDSPSMIYTTTTAGAFRSGDGGLTWESATRGLRVSPDFIADHPWIHTRMFLSGEEGLFVSTDKGTSWIQTIPLGGHLHVRTLTFMPTNAGVIYGAIGSGVIATGDGGFHWETVRYGIASNDIESITLDDRDPRLLYAWTMNGGCYRSTNRGIEWNRYAPPWKPSDTVLIAYDRKLPSSVVALVNSSELYYSSSGGGTWFPVPSKPLDAEPLCMSWHAATSMLYVGTLDKGAYRVSLAKVLAGRR